MQNFAFFSNSLLSVHLLTFAMEESAFNHFAEDSVKK